MQNVGGARWICTYKCALRLWPDAPSHSNQGLRYWRRPVGLARAVGLPAHRAGPDAYVTAHHLRDMLAISSVKQLLADEIRHHYCLTAVEYDTTRRRIRRAMLRHGLAWSWP